MRIWALIPLLVAVAPASAQSEKEAKALMALTAENVRPKVRLKDDSLETTAVLTTEDVFQQKRGLLGIVWADAYLRAFVNKKSGETRYQLYQFVRYQGDWRYFDTVNFSLGGGELDTTTLDVLGRDVEGCTNLLGCTFRETVAFIIPDYLVQKMIAEGKSRGSLLWSYKLKSRRGADWSDGIMVAEMAGLAVAVEQYKRSNNLPVD